MYVFKFLYLLQDAEFLFFFPRNLPSREKKSGNLIPKICFFPYNLDYP